MAISASAPGRVNLIGDHTDYTGGLALPAALPWRTTVRATSLENEVRVSTTLDGSERTDHIALSHHHDDAPSHLVIAQHLAEHRGLGADLHVSSSVPVGAGLSSSAAYCVAVALALGVRGDPWTIARLCQRAEAAAGANVGLLDQIAALCARPGHAVMIDFTHETTTNVALPTGTEIIIIDSGERRSLVTSAYGDRRAACETAAEQIGPLARATVDDLTALSDDVVKRRARHVIRENARVRAAATEAVANDPAAFGALMNESHASLSVDFSVTTPGIDALAQYLQGCDGIYGARMTGGGFGGCLVALARVGTGQLLDLKTRSWIVSPSAGATVDVDPSSSR